MDGVSLELRLKMQRYELKFPDLLAGSIWVPAVHYESRYYLLTLSWLSSQTSKTTLIPSLSTLPTVRTPRQRLRMMVDE